MNLYSAPRPPRKKALPRSSASGRFRAVEPMDDPGLFGFALDAHRSLLDAARFLDLVPIDGDVAADQARAFVVAYLRGVAAAIAPDLVVTAGRPGQMGLDDG